ncbi:MAG: hybrid sensor histidine kinase/response regulator [Anaerolineae bacterium]
MTYELAGTTTEPERQRSDTLVESGWQLQLAVLLQPALRRLATVTALASYVWAMPAFLAYHPTPHWSNLIAPTLLLGAAILSIEWRQYPVAASMLIAGLCASAFIEAAVGHGGAAGWLALAAPIVAGLFLAPPSAVPVAGAVALFAFLIPGARAQALPLVRNAAFGAVLVWAVGGAIHQALRRAQANELRLWEHAREAMERRAELQRTAKALRDMYALLERTNHELEVARREAEEAKELKARFAANVSHELRTPLNLIMGFSRMMCRNPEVYGKVRWTPELRIDVNEIYRASRHLLDMIDDILDLSRIDAQRLPLKLEPASLTTLIEEAAETARGLLRGSSVKLTVSVPPELPTVIVDRTRIRQVLLNLLSNAIRFTDDGEITVTAREADGEVEVAVADTGVGIPAGDLPGIFDEFSQASGPITSGRGGAGLGLAVCKQFVMLHGGRITAQSEIGKGSIFTFSIPIADSGKARSRLVYYSPEGWSPPMPEDSLGKSALVLAPDDASARWIARGIEGYRVIPVSDSDALGSIVDSEHPAGLILVRDPLLPDIGPKPEEIWALTGRADLGIVECEVPLESLAKRHLQVEAYLTKPVQPEQLVAIIERDGSEHDRFLIADDDPGFCTLMERVLSSAFPGARVRTSSGEEALALLGQQRFDVLILDLLMPGLGGIDLLQQARERHLLDETRVIVVTGAPYGEQLGRLLPSRLQFWRKAPPKGSEWFRCIKALLDSAPPDYSLPAIAAVHAEDRPVPLAS